MSSSNREWRRVPPMAEMGEFAEAPGRQMQCGEWGVGRTEDPGEKRRDEARKDEERRSEKTEKRRGDDSKMLQGRQMLFI